MNDAFEPSADPLEVLNGYQKIRVGTIAIAMLEAAEKLNASPQEVEWVLDSMRSYVDDLKSRFSAELASRTKGVV